MIKTMSFFIWIPYFISLLTGFCLISLLIPIKSSRDIPVGLFLSAGLGLGISSFIVFACYLIVRQFHQTFIISVHLGCLLLLLYLYNKKNLSLPKIPAKETAQISTAAGLLTAALIPAGLLGRFYPLGGWDAWQVWNFKAKCLLLGGTHWQNMLQPSLWQTSPHYPLLLPFINVWGWILQENTPPLTPFFTALIFTGITAGLLWAILYSFNLSLFLALIPPLILLSLPFFITIATSQYADILICYYMLASLFCLLKMQEARNPGYRILSALFLGMLAFCKPEGTVLAFIAAIFACVILTFLPSGPGRSISGRLKQGVALLALLFLALLPTIIFNIFFSPGNQTFINGLSSGDHPSTLFRAKMISAFLWVELKSAKWGGVWLLILTGMFLGCKRCFRRDIVLMPLILFSYLITVLFYYFLNTYFKIDWWLQVSLHRILLSLLPALLCWTFISLFTKKEGQEYIPTL